MTQEEKDLLLKDICSRLPYGIKIELTWWDMDEGAYINTINTTLEPDHINQLLNDEDGDTEIKPYLFPLSSMTDEMWDKEFMGYGITEFTRDSFKYGCETLEFNNSNPNLSSTVKFINQLIKNHFDIYGLIPMGLALDATGKSIY